MKLSTGGWFWNESIISALYINKFFNAYIDTEKRGGHYLFVINNFRDISELK